MQKLAVSSLIANFTDYYNDEAEKKRAAGENFSHLKTAQERWPVPTTFGKSSGAQVVLMERQAKPEKRWRLTQRLQVTLDTRPVSDARAEIKHESHSHADCKEYY